MNLFSDIIAHGNRKSFVEIFLTPTPCASASHFVLCVHVYYHYTHHMIMCELHAEARGKDSIQLKNGNSGWGTYTLNL